MDTSCKRTRRIIFTHGLSIGLLLLIGGCITTPTVNERLQLAHELTERAGWQGTTLPTTPYPLYGFLPKKVGRSNTLTIYIEGDGLAWISRRRVSANPTPKNPVALKLALLDPLPAAYLARPCQYIAETKSCDTSLWTSHRFSSDVVTSSNQAIDDLKQRFQAKQLRLVGYSGGGAIAALLAARRDDVTLLVTVAGNLDHDSWTQQHGVSPLTGSLNPIDEWQSLSSVPQIHFVGANDVIVNDEIASSYRARFPPDRQPQIRLVDGADHHCCWEAKWPALLKTLPGSK